LKGLAPNDQAMEQYITNRQKEVFKSHGVEPQKGVDGLAKVTKLFRGDQEIIQLLMSSAGLEENSMNQALGLSAHPQTMEEQAKQMQLLQQKMMDYLSRLNPEERKKAMHQMMESLPPEQREKVMQSMEKELSAPKNNNNNSEPTQLLNMNPIQLPPTMQPPMQGPMVKEMSKQ